MSTLGTTDSTTKSLKVTPSDNAHLTNAQVGKPFTVSFTLPAGLPGGHVITLTHQGSGVTIGTVTLSADFTTPANITIDATGSYVGTLKQTKEA